MMICVAFNGGGGVLSEVSVLCGAGGGLTVQAETATNVQIRTPATERKRREVVGTTFRVSARPARARRASLAARPRGFIANVSAS
jgi:hypothetical protein